MFDELELAYLAGFFDGDGSITISMLKDKTKVRKVGHQVQVLLTQNPPCPILYELLEEFGGKIYKNSKTCHALSWRCPAASHIRFLESILPYLRIKKVAAEIAVEYQQGVDSKPAHRRVTDEEWDARMALYERMQDSFDERAMTMHGRAREQRAE